MKNEITMSAIKNLIVLAATNKEVIVAANRLANAQFEYNSDKIFQKPTGSKMIKKEINNFRQAIKKSRLDETTKKRLACLDDADLCSFADKLTITFMKQEIKT